MIGGSSFFSNLSQLIGILSSFTKIDVLRLGQVVSCFLRRLTVSSPQETYRLTKDKEQLKECAKNREDYFECLHSQKERERMQIVLEEEERQKSGATAGHH